MNWQKIVDFMSAVSMPLGVGACLQRDQIVTSSVDARCVAETRYCLKQHQVVPVNNLAVAAVA